MFPPELGVVERQAYAYCGVVTSGREEFWMNWLKNRLRKIILSFAPAQGMNHQPATGPPPPTQSTPNGRSRLESLSCREQQLMFHLLSGKTIRQSGQLMDITYSTAQFHYKNIYRKLKIHSRYDLLSQYGLLAKEMEQTPVGREDM